ncbi:unnamed protein product [Pleuronectes platessa]|uniref:Eukaryotic translation initiation factor 5A n=1 Tax=Pleuronectes platessa TaxID=8262 RepID=A0A9N7UNC1_PLEPL|nr:unnamed protein product [Pleuronectes platessa]
MIKDRPCKIVEMSTSKTGKHGHAKVHLVGLDLFTQKKCEDLCPSTHNLDVPRVLRKEFEVLCITDGYLTLMNDNGDTREDLKVPEGKLGEEIEERVDAGESVRVTVLEAIGEEHVISFSLLVNLKSKFPDWLGFFSCTSGLGQPGTLYNQ